MTRSEKGSSPPWFEKWKQPGHGCNDLEDWRELRKPQKPCMVALLEAEQRGLCCYCGRVLINVGDDDPDCHIEHLEPRSTAPERTFDHSNLFLSCGRNSSRSSPAATHDPHCGQAKDVAHLDDSRLTPLNPDCEKLVRFSTAGEALVSRGGDIEVERYVKVVRLNAAFLVAQREVLLAAVERGLAGTSVHEMRIRWSKADASGKRLSYANVVLRYLDAYR